MTKLLENAFNQASKLPEIEHNVNMKSKLIKNGKNCLPNQKMY